MIESSNVSSTEQPQVPLTISEDRGIVRAAAVLAVGNVASRVLGLLREIVKSNLFGASDVLAAYSVAALVPMTLFNLITGGEMVSSSLVPVFSDYGSKERRQELWGVVSSFLTLATIVLSIIVLLVELFAPLVAGLAGASNFEDQALVPLTTSLLRLATPAVIFLSIASILTGVLFALKRFNLPAFTGAVFNGTIVAVALLRPGEISSLVIGLLLGSVLQIIIQLPALRDARIRIRFDWRHPAVRRIIVLYTPIVIVLLVNQIAIWISYNLAIKTGDSNVTYMVYATTLYQFPLGLVVSALSIAILPTLSQLATTYREAADNHQSDAQDRLEDYKKTLASGLRLAITLVLPAAMGLFAIALPIITLLLEHGQFRPEDSDITSRVLRLYLFGLPFAAVDQMLVIASYARKDTWRPAAAGVISIVLYTALAAALLPSLGLFSLMAADAIKHIVHTLIMLGILQRQLGGLAGYHITSTLLKSLLAALFTGLVAYGAAVVVSTLLPGHSFFTRLTIVVIAGLAGLLSYIAAAMILDIRDAKSLAQLVRDRIRG